MPNYKNVTGPTPRPRYANPRHPMNRETMMVQRVPQTVTGPKSRPKRPARARQVYTGQTGMYSTD